MAGLDAWTQVPTSLLDAGQRLQDAESWAQQQRTTLADTWANAQRQAITASANAWQQGTQALDSFKQGFSGPAAPSYNDMAGASSSYADTNPPQPTAGSVTAIDQATSPLGPQVGDQTATPLGAALTSPLVEGYNRALDQQQAFEQARQQYGNYSNEAATALQPEVLGVTGGEDQPLVGAGRQIIGKAAEGIGQDLGNVAQGILGRDTERMYHGTGSAFDVPDAGKFDPNGLFGPGYYLTSSPEVASSYANNAQGSITSLQADLDGYLQRKAAGGLSDRQAYMVDQQIAKIRQQIDAIAGPGPNIRAVDVPAGLRLLDADAKPTPEIVSVIRSTLPTEAQPMFDRGIAKPPLIYARGGGIQAPTVGDAIETAFAAGGRDTVNQGLAQAGYDGIQYGGGKRIPMADANGQPIEHQAVVVFPNALGKLRNALSNTYGGLMNEADVAKRTVTATEVKRPGAIGTAGIDLSQFPRQTGPAFPTGPAAIARGALLGGGQAAIGGGIAASQEPGATPGSIALGALKNAPLGMAQGAIGTGLREGLPANARQQAGTVLSRVVAGTGQAANQEGFAGNIRLEKLPEGVRDIVTDAYNQAPAAFEAARRGVIPDSDVAQMASQLGTTAQKLIDRWKPGQAANAETYLAVKNTVVQKAQQVDALKAAAAAPNASPIDLLRFRAAIEDQVNAQKALTGVTAEMGRGLRATRQTVNGAIASGDTTRITDILNRMGGVEWTKELAQQLAQLDTTNPVASYQFMRDAIKPQFKDYLSELRINAMLSGPKTHLVKSLSESISLALSPVERLASAAVEAPLSALQGRPRERFFGEAVPDAVGMVQGIRDGVQAGLFTIQHGFSQSDLLGNDFIRRQAFKGPLGTAINMPTRMLAAASEMMGTIASSGAMNAYAYRKAAMEGLSGDALVQRMADLRANPTPDMLAYAHDTGKYRVYQQKPGETISALLNLRNKTPLGRFAVPFLLTPANLLKFGLTRSPMGVLNPTMYKNIAAKNPEAADQIGRVLLGSMIAAAIKLEFNAGNITGAAPTNPAERDAWARQGKTPFSFHIGQNWYSFQRLEPLNQTFSQVAAVVDAMNQGKDPSATAQQAVATIGSNLISQTYMKTLSDTLSAIKDPGQAGSNFINGIATSFNPAAIRDIAQIQDPTYRQTANPIEALQATIPGMSQNLPPVLTAFGQERPRETSNISPIAVSPSHVDPVDAELAKYNVEPGLTGKTMRGIDLTRQEIADHQRIAGQLVRQRLGQVINDPRYAQLNDLQKAHILQLTITRAKDQAAQQYLGQLVQTQGKAALLQRIQQKKLSRLPAAS